MISRRFSGHSGPCNVVVNLGENAASDKETVADNADADDADVDDEKEDGADADNDDDDDDNDDNDDDGAYVDFNLNSVRGI